MKTNSHLSMEEKSKILNEIEKIAAAAYSEVADGKSTLTERSKKIGVSAATLVNLAKPDTSKSYRNLGLTPTPITADKFRQFSKFLADDSSQELGNGKSEQPKTETNNADLLAGIGLVPASVGEGIEPKDPNPDLEVSIALLYSYLYPDFFRISLPDLTHQQLESVRHAIKILQEMN